MDLKGQELVKGEVNQLMTQMNLLIRVHIEETKDTTKEVQDSIDDEHLTFNGGIPYVNGHPLPRQVQERQEASLGVDESTRRHP
ncbi:hypothetical protein A2U01_0034740 [Trifolium medium]|uniref:Uncharacterized protein n=1 Tax=Trifolium medium TaxID=97028 RepID=A0A392PNF1_9FABA|nr:hypothetical protein [Trifolium medium]